MKNRNLFLFLVILVIVTPAIHYFIAGENYDNSSTRNALVGVQMVVGIALLLLFGRKPGSKSPSDKSE